MFHTLWRFFWSLFGRSFQATGEQLLKAKPVIMIQEKGKWILPLPFGDSFHLWESKDQTWDD